MLHTGHFKMFSVFTKICNKKTKAPTSIELFTGTGKMKKIFLTTRDVRCGPHGRRWARMIAAVQNIDAPMLTRVWQDVEFRIDVCRFTRGAHIEHL
jgi:hypothetical protein